MSALAPSCFRPAEAIPAWALMWGLAGAIYAGCKGASLVSARSVHPRIHPASALGYLLLWPGLDARSFLTSAPPPSRPPSSGAWLSAGARTIAGALLLAFGPRSVHAPLLAGWLGMIGLVLVLHFGSFALLALSWQSLGYRAQPLMRQPLLSESLSELWGARWNTAFSDLSRTVLLPPLRRLVRAPAAVFLVFVLSGLIHDCVISLPARGGYGLPTLYFTIQGAGVVLERSSAGRALGLRSGWPGRLFIFFVAFVPLGLLFHAPFVLRVIVPFLRAIHAL